MKTLFAFALIFSLNSLATPNSIVAIVNDELITFDAISAKIKPASTKAEKIKLIDNQINLVDRKSVV